MEGTLHFLLAFRWHFKDRISLISSTCCQSYSENGYAHWSFPRREKAPVPPGTMGVKEKGPLWLSMPLCSPGGWTSSPKHYLSTPSLVPPIPSSHCGPVPTFQPGPSKLTSKAARSVSTSPTVKSSSESQNLSIAACKTVWGCSPVPGPEKNLHNLL